MTVIRILHYWQDDERHFLLIRRSINDPQEQTFYLVFAPQAIPLQAMVTAIGARWHVEEDFENSNDLGLDEYEVRSWIGWYRHITLVLLTYASLASICATERFSSGAPALDLAASFRSWL